QLVPIPSQPDLLDNCLIKKAKSLNYTSNLEDSDNEMGESHETLSKNQQISH
ncbi:1578_t:CDS:1, partial [Gigaspora margarita]